MEAQEFDIALTELETRVDRLRALYENWFRGYEKTEPNVARKDVERRVYGLRKELPRNTALRFRYHQLYQRFCTLANYWQRTARQVEEGTYRMQLQRMRRRKDEQAARSIAPRAGNEEGEGLAQKSYELNLDETLDVGSLLDDFELDQVANAIDAPGPYVEPQAVTNRPVARFRPPGAAPSPTLPERPSLTLDRLQSFGGIPSIMGPSAANDGQTTAPPARGSLPMETLPAPGRPSLAVNPMAAALEERLLTARQGAPSIPAGSPRADALPAGAPRAPIASGAQTSAVQTSAAQTNVARRGAAQSSAAQTSAAQVSAAQASAAQASAAHGAQVSGVQRNGVLASGLQASGAQASGAASGAHAGGAQASAAQRSAAQVAEGQAGARPATPGTPAVRSTVGQAAPAPARPSPPGQPAFPARPSAATPSAAGSAAGRPAVPPSVVSPAAGPRPVVPPPPAAGPRPVVPPAPPPRAPAPAAAAPSISDQQIRRIYDDYVAARRKNNEGDVRYETLASSINKMLPDLQKRHQGKRIDFEIVLKDGRVGLKPKAT